MHLKRHRNFIGLASFEMLAMFRRGLFYSFLTIYLRHYLGLGVTATTLFATLPMIVNIMAQSLIWGRISDRFQVRRSLIVAGEVLAALGTIGVWYLHRQPVSPLVAGYVIILGLTAVELFWSMSNISWSALISDLYGELDRGSVQGRLASMGGVGRMAGVWGGSLFYDGLGRHFEGWGFYEGTLFYLAAGVMLVSVAPLFLLPEGGTGPADKTRRTEIRPSSSDPANIYKFFIPFLIGLALINFGRNSMAIVFPQYLSADSGAAVSSSTLGLILNTQSVAIISFGWCAGWLCKRWGSRSTLLLGGMCAVVALAILSAFTALPMIYAGSFLRGVADATIMAAGYEIASALIPPARRARGFAWYNATFFLSWGVPATLMVGPLVDRLIQAGIVEGLAYRWSFAAAGAVTAVGFVLVAGLMMRMKTIVPSSEFRVPS